MIELLIGCTIGLICGSIGRGITINVVHKPVDNEDKPKKYNESLAGMLPAEVQQYYSQTQGQNKF